MAAIYVVVRILNGPFWYEQTITILNHSKTELRNVRYWDGVWIEVLGIRAPAVSLKLIS